MPAALSGSGGVAFVPVMQATHLRDRHDPALTGRLDRARNRRVRVEREMRARSFVGGGVALHQPLQTGRAAHDHVIEALTSRGADEPFDVCVLPRGARRREEVVHAHRLRGVRPSVEGVIAVVEHLARCFVPRERFAQRLSRHAAGGCAVTATCTMRRRSWARITKTNTSRHVAVGTTKKSAATSCAR